MLFGSVSLWIWSQSCHHPQEKERHLSRAQFIPTHRVPHLCWVWAGHQEWRKYEQGNSSSSRMGGLYLREPGRRAASWSLGAQGSAQMMWGAAALSMPWSHWRGPSLHGWGSSSVHGQWGHWQWVTFSCRALFSLRFWNLSTEGPLLAEKSEFVVLEGPRILGHRKQAISLKPHILP